MPLLAGVVGLVARRAEEDARRVQELGEREDDHQRRDQRKMDEQRRIGRQRPPVETASGRERTP